jgi:mono/diheme cytochrome c family protein
MVRRARILLVGGIVTLALADTTHAADLARGQALYEHYCAACHAAGEGHPGTMRLSVRADAAHAVLIERRDLRPAYVAGIVRNGLQMMPPFRPSELSDEDLSHLAAFVAQHYEASP